MTDFIDGVLEPPLWFLADWSLRWALLVAVLALWLILIRPRRSATRYLLCLVVFLAGLILPALPRWGTGFTLGSRKPFPAGSIATMEDPWPRQPGDRGSPAALQEEPGERSQAGLDRPANADRVSGAKRCPQGWNCVFSCPGGIAKNQQMTHRFAAPGASSARFPSGRREAEDRPLGPYPTAAQLLLPSKQIHAMLRHFRLSPGIRIGAG